MVDRQSDKGNSVGGNQLLNRVEMERRSSWQKFWHCRVVVATLRQLGGACGWDSLGWSQEGPL